MEGGEKDGGRREGWREERGMEGERDGGRRERWREEIENRREDGPCGSVP